MCKETLVKAAFAAMENAYAPYSNYHVGAAILTNDDKIIIGANVENASYGATNCAERTALFAAYAQGYRQEDIKGLAIVSDGEILAGPCGICRQVISELMGHQTPIYLANATKNKTTNIEELLPMSFSGKDLEK